MFSGLNLLVVDDRPITLALLERILPSLGATHVSTAANGSSALTKFADQEKPFDCVIADVFMAPGNGLELLHAIRTNRVQNAKPDLCVLLMSANAETGFAETAKKLDANGFLKKPFTASSLSAAIRDALEKSFHPDIARYLSVPPEALIA